MTYVFKGPINSPHEHPLNVEETAVQEVTSQLKWAVGADYPLLPPLQILRNELVLGKHVEAAPKKKWVNLWTQVQGIIAKRPEYEDDNDDIIAYLKTAGLNIVRAWWVPCHQSCVTIGFGILYYRDVLFKILHSGSKKYIIRWRLLELFVPIQWSVLKKFWIIPRPVLRTFKTTHISFTDTLPSLLVYHHQLHLKKKKKLSYSTIF